MWKRVLIPIAIVTLMWVVVSGFMTAYVHWLEQSYQQVLVWNVASIEGDAELRIVTWRTRARLASSKKLTAPEISELRMRAEKATQSLRNASYLPGEARMAMSVSAQVENYFDLLEQLVPEKNNVVSVAALHAELTTLSLAIVDESRRIRDMNAAAIAMATVRWKYWKGIVFALQTILSLLGPSIGIALGWGAAKRYRESVSRIDITLSGAVDSAPSRLAQVELRPQDDLMRINDKVNHVVRRIHQVTAELNVARQEAQRAERLAAVGELAASVAHEIRNPLTSVKLLLQHAERDVARRLTQTQIHVILEEVTRIEGTIQGLLDFSRPPAMHRHCHDFRHTIRRSLDLVEAKARHAGVRLVSTIEDRSLPLEADSEQLHQVLVNLLLNGIEAMPTGGTLELRALIPSDEVASVRVDIFDTGGGIPSSVAGRLFEPFVSTKEGGTGLGLAVCYRIVTEHGGTLAAENRPGGGAAFTISLPRGPEIDQDVIDGLIGKVVAGAALSSGAQVAAADPRPVQNRPAPINASSAD